MLRVIFYFSIVGVFVIFEQIKPFHQINQNGVKKGRLFNLYLAFITVLAGQISILTIPLTAAYVTQVYHIGLKYWMGIPNWLMYIIWFIVLDLIIYFTHRLAHWSDVLWEFHKVHHSDMSPNVTTTLREHPFDFLLVNFFKVILAFVFGPTFFQMLICDLLITLLLTWEHCNIRIPWCLEKIMSRIICSPRYHIYHHTIDRANFNFATGLSIWDKITNRQILPHDTDEEINQFKIGLPSNEKHMTIRQAIFYPFVAFMKQSIHKKIMTGFWLFCFTTWIVAIEFPETTYGLAGFSPVTMVAFAIVCFHLSTICISVYLHRSETHRSISYRFVLRHLFRFWLWIATGIDRGNWVAVHRYHHQNTDTESDPHSPLNTGLNWLFLNGIENYNQVYEQEEIKRLNVITDNDWLEKNVYVYQYGVLLFLILTVVLFGIWGIPIWIGYMGAMITVQNYYINGIGHYFGYRNFNTIDNSKNISKIGVFACGEELHNNHHQSPKNPRFSRRKNEFDLGWLYISLLLYLKMARLRELKPAKVSILDTLNC